MNFWLFIYSLTLAIAPTLVGPIFFPFLKLNFFAPFLVLLLYKKPLIKTLWHGFYLGFILDLLAASLPFGFWTFNILLTILFLYKLKRFFFEDKFLTLPLLSLFFSFFSSALYLLLNHLFIHSILFRWEWVFTDLCLYPLFDGIYALIFFNLPLYYLSHLLPDKKRVIQSFKLNEN